MAYIQRCPKCGSNDVRKIGFVEAYLHFKALGFLSRTALSDYKCCRCGCAPVFSPFENHPDEEKAAQTFIAMLLLSEKILKGSLK